MTAVVTETGTADRTQADGAPGTCRYPGCAGPARLKDPAAPGPRPGYCEQEVPQDRGDGTPALVRHTAMTAFRRRAQLAGQPGQDRPVTAAISRAAAIRDDAIAAMSRLGAQLSAALDQIAALGEQLAAAGDPEAAEAQAEAVRAQTAVQLEQARAQTDRQPASQPGGRPPRRRAGCRRGPRRSRPGPRRDRSRGRRAPARRAACLRR